MKTLTTICALIAVPLVAFAGDDAAKKAPAAGAPAPVKQAEPPKPAAPPTPAKELDVAKGFAKTWACTGTNDAGDKVAPKLSWKLDVDKFWYAVRMDRPKTKSSPAFTGVGYIGIDPVGKGWVFEGFDNMGGMIHLKAAAAAVTAEQAVFEGEAASGMGKAPAKFTLKLDPKAKTLNFVGEFGGKKEFDYACK